MSLRCCAVALLAAAYLAPLTAAQQNVLLIIADDVGVDMIGAYGEHPLPANTPVLDHLAADGILFRNAWSLATCTPTRAALLTGRMPYQTGIGRAMFPFSDPYEVALAETTLPELLGPTWDKAAIGKWHMHSGAVSGITHPLLQGFDNHRGSPWNLPGLLPSSYFNYSKSVDGNLVRSTTYATTDSVDDALELISEYQNPWFVWLAFNTPHTPWHDPPHRLHSEQVPTEPTSDPPVAVRAMIEAMDTEIGRLFDSIDPDILDNTLVIFIGDNGTHQEATTPPFDPGHAKGSLFEGGINVPLIISGRGVKKGFRSNGLVQATDIFTTILDIAGIEPPHGTTGVSLVPYFQKPQLQSLRPWVDAERFLPNGFGPYIQHQRAIRDTRYKLLRDVTNGVAASGQTFYDLVLDPFETTDLLSSDLSPQQKESYTKLNSVLDSIVPPWTNLRFAKGSPTTFPHLTGGGTLLPDDTVNFDLSDAPKNATAWMFIGSVKLQQPFKGGILVPDPGGSGLTIPLETDALGELVLAGTWPDGLPPGFELFVQFWIPEADIPTFWTASNALKLTTP
jgi:arylsulfatase A-like enzyme